MAKKRILVVEDERDNQEILRHYLEKAGYEMKGCVSGEEGFKALPDFLPDLVLLDVNLPGADGYEICRRIRKDARFARLPIIMITVNTKPEETVKGLRLGADDYVGKPFEPKEILARIAALLRAA
jgi:DNA-binding response OmpR family regulator